MQFQLLCTYVKDWLFEGPLVRQELHCEFWFCFVSMNIGVLGLGALEGVFHCDLYW